MGYTTDFIGRFKLNKKLDSETHTFLTKFNETRRMGRNLPEEFGVEGELFVAGEGFAGQDRGDTIIDYNTPPKTQPSLWCKWRPSQCGNFIEWDEEEKFYSYIEWIEYLIEKILTPKGYVLNGSVEWGGEDRNDVGTITIKDNVVSIV